MSFMLHSNKSQHATLKELKLDIQIKLMKSRKKWKVNKNTSSRCQDHDLLDSKVEGDTFISYDGLFSDKISQESKTRI